MININGILYITITPAERHDISNPVTQICSPFLRRTWKKRYTFRVTSHWIPLTKGQSWRCYGQCAFNHTSMIHKLPFSYSSHVLYTKNTLLLLLATDDYVHCKFDLFVGLMNFYMFYDALCAFCWWQTRLNWFDANMKVSYRFYEHILHYKMR